MKKFCKRCDEETERYKRDGGCRKCKQRYYFSHQQRIILYKREFYQQNKGKMLEKNKIYRIKHKDEVSNRERKFYLSNKKEILKRAKCYSHSPAKYETFAGKLVPFDEVRMSVHSTYMEVKCSYCGVWFSPSTLSAQNRGWL